MDCGFAAQRFVLSLVQLCCGNHVCFHYPAVLLLQQPEVKKCCLEVGIMHSRSRYIEVHVRVCEAGTGQVPSHPCVRSDTQSGLCQLPPLLVLLLSPLLVMQCHAYSPQT